MVALTLIDHLMMQHAQCELFPNTAAVEDQPNPMGKTARRAGGPVRAVVGAAINNTGSSSSSSSSSVSQRIDEE
jgi:hypothetical protein